MMAPFEPPPPRFDLRNDRERILVATASVVVANGYGATTTDQIAEAAGVSAADVERLVGDVESCARDACIWSVHRAFAVSLHAYSRPGSWPVRVRDALTAGFRLLARVPDLVALNVLVLPTLGDLGAYQAISLREPFTALLEPGMAQQAAAGQPVPDGTADFVAGAVFQTLVRYAHDGRVADLPEAVPDLLRLILSPFCEPQEIEALLR